MDSSELQGFTSALAVGGLYNTTGVSFWSKRGLTGDSPVLLIKIVIYYFQQECGLMETEIKVAAAHRDSTIQLIS